MPLNRGDYLFAGAPLLLLGLFMAVILIGGIKEEAEQNRRNEQTAERFWIHLTRESPIEGRNENGDCFLFAIGLRNLIQDETGEEAHFTFVRWLDLDPTQGPTIHVYTEFDAMGQSWVMDNMGAFHRFPKATTPVEWMKVLAPKGHPYQIIGDTKALVDYTQKQM